MKIKSSSFKNYPFTKLFLDYTDWNESIQPFFEFNPFLFSDYKKRIQNIRFDTDRKDIVSALTEFNLKYGANDQTLEKIKKLENADVFTVVTGQQVTLFGGPLFTIYKIVTAITIADKLTKELDKVVIPVFWMADEDHDFDEVSSISIPDGDLCTTYKLNQESYIENRVVEKKLNGDFLDLREKIRNALPDTDFSNDLWLLLDQCYKSGETFGSSFGRLILKLFGKHGLILAGSNQESIKKLIIEPLVSSVKYADDHHKILQESSEALSKEKYHTQVTVQSSNLFLIGANGSREKLQNSGEEWYIEGREQSWSSDELISKIESTPEKLSPNVFLRPIIQNHILPVISYVAGPGEIAYYAQMRSYHHQFDIEMPIISPRFSATLIESSIDRIIGKLPFQLHDYYGRIEDLEKDFLKQSDSPDLESIFKGWKSSITDHSESPISKISEIDPTLKKSADKTVNQFFTELDKLKGKLYRSVKESEKIQIQRIQRVQNNLYPNRNLQEREVAFITLMNKYGLNLWDKMINEIRDEELKTHKIIYL